MGGRYGGQIRGRGSKKPFIRAMERLGTDTRRPFEAIGKATRKAFPRIKDQAQGESA